VIQNTAPAFRQSYGMRSYDHFSPKLGLLWQAYPSMSLRDSYGAGFRQRSRAPRTRA
jgi:outer membrane receptor protein involved in Fe transport